MSGIPGSSPSPMSMSAPTPTPPPNVSMNNGPMPNSAAAGSKRLIGVGDTNEVLDKKRLQELVKEVDPNEQLDEEVENMLLQIADDFIEQVQPIMKVILPIVLLTLDPTSPLCPELCSLCPTPAAGSQDTFKPYFFRLSYFRPGILTFYNSAVLE